MLILINVEFPVLSDEAHTVVLGLEVQVSRSRCRDSSASMAVSKYSSCSRIRDKVLARLLPRGLGFATFENGLAPRLSRAGRTFTRLPKSDWSCRAGLTQITEGPAAPKDDRVI